MKLTTWFCFLMVAALIDMEANAQTTAPTGPDSLSTYRSQQQIFRQAAERAASCVVTIETVGGTQPVPAGARPGFIIADGPTTGLIWSADGLILTSAFNFVRDPSVITVILPDGRRMVGELLARDEVRRLAMVKIEASGLPVPKWVREASGVRVGQWTLALGRGFGGKDPSVSAGIISGLNRKGGVAVQTDAKLSPANFGGPLIDVRGRVIGLIVPMGLGNDALAGAEWYDSGIGFAVPLAQAGKSAESLAVRHNLRRGLLGVLIGRRGGVRISALAERSPAVRAGLAAGDLILAIDNKTVKEYADLQRLMSARLAGEKVTLRIKRGQEEMDIQVVLGVPEDMGNAPIGKLEPEPVDTQPAGPRPDDS